MIDQDEAARSVGKEGERSRERTRETGSWGSEEGGRARARVRREVFNVNDPGIELRTRHRVR